MKLLGWFYPKGVFYALFVLTIFLVGVIFGQTYQLEWSVMDAGGNEAGDSIYSSAFRLTSAIGQGTAIGDSSWVHSSSYLVHPGFRKIDLDWRPSFTQLVGTVALVDTITYDSVVVQWTGQDTTTEEGPGWGIWMYDVQYRDDTTGTPGTWTDLIDSTFTTSYTMTGLSNGHWYCFRVRAHDLATNVGSWDTISTIVAIDSVYVNTALYSLELHTTDELCSLWVDGTSHPAPFFQNYSGGALVHVDVADSVNFGDTVIAIFDHWAVSAGTDTFLDITIADNTVDTAVYNFLYSLDVTSDNDTPVPDGHNWYPAGDTVSGYITNPIVDIGGGDWAICTGFHGTGSAPGIASGTSFFIDSLLQPSTITWDWDTTNDITSLCTLVVFSPYGHPMPADTTVYPIGTSIMAQVENMVVMGADTHYCTGWMGGGSVSSTGVGNSFGFVITENSWIVWCWDSDCKLPLVVENDGMTFDPVDGYDTPVPTVGLHWYSPDTLINASVTTPADGMQCVGYWGSGSIPSADSTTTVSFYLDSPSWIHWRWFDEDTAIVCLTVWSEYDSPNPPMGTSCYPIDTDIHATVTSPTDGHTCTGYWGTGSAPTDTSGIDPTPYDITFTLDVNSQLVWVWDGVLRFPLVVTNDGVTPSNPDGYDTPTPFGLNWYDAGSDVNCSVTSPADGMQCLGHIGTGSVSTDTSLDFTFTIDEPSEVYWYWESDTATIVYLTVWSEYGDPTPSVGTMGYHIGTFISAFVQDSAYDGSIWHYNSGWSGGGSVPASGDSNAIDFTINTSSWIVWQWDGSIRWPFVVVSAHDSPVPPVGTNWYNDGDTVAGSIDLVDGGWRCLGYNGWGDLGSAPYNHFSFVIGQPSGVDWIWDTLTNVRQLIVRKNPNTDTWGGIAINGDWSWGVSAETVYVTPSSVVSIEVSNPDVSGLSRYSFVQWSDGSTDTNRTETIASDAEFVANYDLEHFVVVQKDPTGDTYGNLYVDASTYSGAASIYQEFWWIDGSSHDIAVSPLDTTSTERYTFAQWEDASTDSARTVTITGPDTFTASYNAQYLIVIQKVDSASLALEVHGCIYTPDTTVCGVGEYSFWADGGSVISFAVSEKDTVGDSLYTFYKWTDGGTDTLHSSFTVDSADTYVAMYEGLQYVICIELWQHSAIPESVIWIPSPSDTIIDPTATYSMTSGDVITLHNCGTVDAQLWLGVLSCKDTLDADVPWMFTMNGGDRNNISLRGRFENSATAPSYYSPVLDYLKFGTLEKATDASESSSPIFGPYGGRLGTSQDLYLFFQLVSPSSSDYYGLTEIIVGLKATIRLP